MKITRRQAMIGTATVGMTLPVVSNARPISSSPLLNVFADHASLTRIDYAKLHEDPPPPPDVYVAGTSELWMSQLDKFYADRALIFPVSIAHGEPVNSVEEAEDILLHNLPQPNMTWYPQVGPPPTFVGEPATPLAILANRGCNLIHARTRLARGDTILLSPKALKEGFYPSDGFQPMAKQRHGRWRQVGHLNCTVRVFVGEHLSDDQVFVVATQNDNHALLIQSASGLHLVREQGGERAGPDSIDFFINIGMSY